MKKINLLLLMTIIFSCGEKQIENNVSSIEENSNSQSVEQESKLIDEATTTTIRFNKYIHDFGKVKVESSNVYEFEFVNSGIEPLLISNCKGSCGCTVPEWPSEPIAPGKKGKIKVKFSKPNPTVATQKVTVFANTNPLTTELTIKAEVIK